MPPPPPSSQRVLLLHAPKQPYTLTDDYAVPPFVHDRELLVRTRAIGLNPIDWKAPDFNFGIPTLPYISGRELTGNVVHLNKGASRFQPGDRVLAISTDYRDSRKGAYQQYVIAWDFNTVRLPRHVSYEAGATLGVAFVAAVLALGVSMGVDFASVADGPDLLRLLRQLPPGTLPADIRDECLHGIAAADRARPGDWLAVWGGSATSANVAIQLAHRAGLRVAAVVDAAKHGLRLADHDASRPDLLVDSHDPQRAVAVLRRNLGPKLRFGLDTRGRDSATWLLQALSPAEPTTPPSPPQTPTTTAITSRTAHLVGLTGLPKPTASDTATVFHTVPIKVFHEIPVVGEALSVWLERLLETRQLVPPDIIGVETGLESINAGLDRMRAGEISGGRLVVRLDEDEGCI